MQTKTGDFLTELTSCDGSDAQIVSDTQCAIPLTTLITSPFDLEKDDQVYVRVTASNLYGESEISNIGSGAVIVLVPDAPLTLNDVPEVTLQDRIGLAWTDGVADGGTPIIDYQIWYDQGT